MATPKAVLWAWHNPHLTKKISEEQRITQKVKISKTRDPPKSGRTRRRRPRPPTSVLDKIKNLHLLLRVPSFSRWPLGVKFFCEDVYQVWQAWSERVDGRIRSGIGIVPELKQPIESTIEGEVPLNSPVKGKRKRETAGKGGIHDINVDYSRIKIHLEKSQFLLAEGERHPCAICAKEIDEHVPTALVCPSDNCRTVFHMPCLASRFLEEERTETSLLPTAGKCPQCELQLQWIDLVKEMTLRLRGQKEVALLMKKPKERKIKSFKAKSTLPIGDVEQNVDQDNDLESGDDGSGENLYATGVEDDPLPDDWIYREGSEDDLESVISAASDYSFFSDTGSPTKGKKPAPKLEVVIEESDWDGAEVLD
ncbi:Slx4p interacting protein [Toensbergia leucococca]|nr:Slx4p interacting protein [Toensbergia leucococca]